MRDAALALPFDEQHFREIVRLILRSYEELHATGDIPWTRDHTRRKVNAGQFPAPVVLSRDPSGKPRRVRWVVEEIEAYKAKLIADRDGTAAE